MRRSIALAIAVSAAAVACGDDSSVDGDGGTPDAPSFPSQAGLVTLSSSMASSTGLSAGFYKTAVGGDGCTRVSEATCTATTCPVADVAGVYAVSAGAITAAAEGGTMMAIPAPDGTYAFVPGGAIFPSGTTITISAAGEDIPAFSGTVVMPASIAVTDPAAPEGLVIDRTSDLPFAWTAGTGDVYVYIDDLGAQSLVYPLTVGTVVRCVFPSTAGSGTIPKGILGHLEVGDATIAITGFAEAAQDVVGFDVRLRAVAYDYVGMIMIM